MQLKETYTGAVQERLAIEAENQKLKELLQLHGIAFNAQNGNTAANYHASYNGGSSTGSQSASYHYNQGFSPPQHLSSGETSPSTHAAAQAGSELIGGPQSSPSQQQQGGGGSLDQDQLGVDFILASVPRQGPPARYISPPYHNIPPSRPQ